MAENIKERLLSYLRYKKVNNSEFGRMIGVSNAYITSIRKSIQPDKLEKISECFPDLDISWLITGEGEMLNDKPSAVQHNNNCSNCNNINGVNVTTDIAGKSCNTVQPVSSSMEVIPEIPVEIYKQPQINVVEYIEQNEYRLSKKPKVPLFPKYDVLYNVYDSSMSPDFKAGDVLALQVMDDSSFIINGEPYVINTYSSGLVFRLVYDNKETEFVTCRSFNTDRFSDFDIRKSDIVNIFRIVGQLRINV